MLYTTTVKLWSQQLHYAHLTLLYPTNPGYKVPILVPGQITHRTPSSTLITHRTLSLLYPANPGYDQGTLVLQADCSLGIMVCYSSDITVLWDNSAGHEAQSKVMLECTKVWVTKALTSVATNHLWQYTLLCVTIMVVLFLTESTMQGGDRLTMSSMFLHHAMDKAHLVWQWTYIQLAIMHPVLHKSLVSENLLLL